MILMPVGMTMLVSIAIRRMRMARHVDVSTFRVVCIRWRILMRVAMRNGNSSEQ